MFPYNSLQGSSSLIQGSGTQPQTTYSPVAATFTASQLQPTGTALVNQTPSAPSPSNSVGVLGYGTNQAAQAYNYNTGYGTGGGAAAAPAYDPGDMAYLDDARARLERQLQSAAKAKQSGLTQLEDSYNQQVSGTNRQRSRALEDFGVQREDTTRAKDAAIQRVNTNARTLADSLRRRIGMASGSGSSAYQITAPGAVAREASQDRTGVVENFGVNFRNLATAEERAKSDFERYLDELQSQYKSRKSDFMAGLYEQQNNISQSLAEVARQRALLQGGGYDRVREAMSPYTSQIEARQNAIDGLFAKYRTPYNIEKVKVDKPNLRDYTVDNAQIQADQKAGDIYSPYAMPREDDEQFNGLY